MSAKRAAAEESAPVDFKTLDDKLVWVREHIGNVEKSKTNQHLRYQYRTEDDYYNAIRPLLNAVRVNLRVSDEGVMIDGGYVFITMRYTYVDAETGSEFGVQAMGQGDVKDGGGIKKAKTGCARYHFQKQFLIADGQDDEEDYGAPIRPRAAESAPAPAQTSPAPARDFTAKRTADRLPPKEVVKLVGAAYSRGVDAREECQARYGCELGELHKDFAAEWTEELRGMPRKVDVVTAAKAADLRAMIEGRGANIAVYLDRYKVTHLEMLTAAQAHEIEADLSA